MVQTAQEAPVASPETPRVPAEQPSQEAPRRGGAIDWFRTLLTGGPGEQAEPSSSARSAPSENDEQTEREEGAPPEVQAVPAQPAWAPPKSREEYEEAVTREAQSRTDRAEEKRRRDEERALSDRVKQSQNTQLQQLEQQKNQAIEDGDLAQARTISQQQRVVLAQQQQGQWFERLQTGFDVHMLLPVLSRLPKPEQERIAEGISGKEPLPERKAAVEDALGVFEKQVRADEARKARLRLKTDDVFWKEMRASHGDEIEDEEPEHVSGTPSRNGRTDAGSLFGEMILNARGR